MTVRATLSFVVIAAMVATSALRADDVALRLAVDRRVLPPGQAQKVVVMVVLDAPKPKAPQRLPVNLALVLDRSGSMRGEKLAKTKEAAIEALRRLDARDLFSLVIYDDRVETLVPAQSAANTEWIVERINSITDRGSTALFAGLSQGAAELRKHPSNEYVHRVILVSDGLANVGPSSPGDLERLGRSLIKEGITVTTVGVGTDYNEDLMTRLSQASDGNSYFVNATADLPRIFGGELGDVLSVAARTVKIEIQCAEGVTPVRLIGREGRIVGSQAEVYLNQLYGGQQKYALLEVEVPATAGQVARPLATAKVTYDDVATAHAAVATATVSVQFTGDVAAQKAGADAAVQTAVGANTAALALDVTVDLMDQQKGGEAVANLKFNAQSLRAVGKEFQNDALLQQAADLDKRAAELEDRGMDARSRKGYRTESYQQRNQQEAR